MKYISISHFLWKIGIFQKKEQISSRQCGTLFTVNWFFITWTITPKLKIWHIIICCHRLAICLLPIYAQFARLQISANLYAKAGPYQLIEQHFVVATFQNTKRCKERSIFIFHISSSSTRKCWGLLINRQDWWTINNTKLVKFAHQETQLMVFLALFPSVDMTLKRLFGHFFLVNPNYELCS